jgi:hypothetical protein
MAEECGDLALALQILLYVFGILLAPASLIEWGLGQHGKRETQTDWPCCSALQIL